MLFTINIEMDKEPTTCFDCDFASKFYCWATCPFLKTTYEDEKAKPRKCPLRKRVKPIAYSFDNSVYKTK